MDGLSLLYSLVQITDDVGKRTGFWKFPQQKPFREGWLGPHPRQYGRWSAYRQK